MSIIRCELCEKTLDIDLDSVIDHYCESCYYSLIDKELHSARKRNLEITYKKLIEHLIYSKEK